MTETVAAARVRELISREIQPLVAGMELVRAGAWARSLTDEVRAVVQITPLKAAQYDLTYGVCCAWVPKSGTSSRFGHFPRTLKQTTLHLWVDHFTADALPRQRVSTLDDERTVERQTAILARQVMDRAPAWWRSVDSPDGVLAEARRQALNEFDLHVPRARVVAAFTLARMGEVEAARFELGEDDDDDLQSLLAKVPVPGRACGSSLAK